MPDICEAHVEAVLAAARSEKPSARVNLPGGKELVRRYDILTVTTPESIPEPVPLPCPGKISWGDYEISAEFGTVDHSSVSCFSGLPARADHRPQPAKRRRYYALRRYEAAEKTVD